MNLSFYRIPVVGGEQETESLNGLLNSVRVLTVDREFVNAGENSYWAICVQFLATSQRQGPSGKKNSIDYREVLSPADFAVYAKLRDLRKVISQREAIPPYSIFTNEQLSQMVQLRTVSKAALSKIDGVGPSRVENYGRAFLDVLTGAFHSSDEQEKK